MPYPTEQETGLIYCQPHGYPHFDRISLAWCQPCGAWHHDDYTCIRSADAVARRFDDPDPQELPEYCNACKQEHGRRDNCPRAWCADCDDWHECDEWGDITCPGWYCAHCDDHHDYGEDCPEPYCEDCGDYHAPGECDSCGCAAPLQDFTVPNDGQPPLHSGQRATVHLAAGVISEQGIREIGYCLRGAAASSAMCDLSYDLDVLGNRWQAKQGNYTKRLSAHAYKNHGIKIDPATLSRVGTIARDHSSAADAEIDVTRDLNRPAHEFYHEDSCWWGGYSSSRCALKSNGGFALRSFSGTTVSGRAWVMPLRSDGGTLVPTFDTESPDALVVFNGYGELSGYSAARVVAAMYGLTYSKISFDASPMYINSGGYIVGPEDIVQKTGSVCLTLSQHADLYERELSHAAAA